MKHEPRPACHMQKQLGWAHKLGGTESLGISRVGQTMLARLMESQISGKRYRMLVLPCFRNNVHSLLFYLEEGRIISH